MAETFHFELISPENKLLAADLSEAVLPGQEGDLTAMAGRALMILKLRPGILTAKAKDGEKQYFLRGGLADVGPQETIVLAEYAIPLSDLTGEILEDEIGQAQQTLDEAADDVRRISAWDRLERLQTLKARLSLK
ncbi:MAG: F0F1 ATP synthase subunit epsilon [Rhodomicrobium sp.]|jgi:F-type H+-transporting ATPase subunit epsilon